jgi:mRNA interferase RelE/StbE
MRPIVFTTRGARDFEALPDPARKNVAEALSVYAVDGRGDVKRLKGRDGHRLRVGDYRAIFAQDAATILAIRCGRKATTS